MSSLEEYWIPLESNPAVLTEFAEKLGTPAEWGFSDCFGLDDELLSFVPHPCLALILLFPCSKIGALREGKSYVNTTPLPDNVVNSSDFYFMKQLVGNACGTVAIVHAIANNRSRLNLSKDSFFSKFLQRTKDLDPDTRGNLFGGEQDLKEAHTEAANHGQTDAPEADAKIDHHFVCFVEVGDQVLEFDGGREGPISHGPTNDNFLKSAAAVIKREYLERLPDELGFSVIAFGPRQPND